jgi:hypothetical protein
MEAFFDPGTKKPVQQIDVPEGGTKILGLKKFTLGDVAVRTGDYKIGLVDMVIRLKDATKKSYDNNYNQHAVAADTNPVIVNDTLFFQVLGNNAGSTELSARFTKTPGSPAYAPPVTINVTPNKKRLVLFPNMPFTTLWANHPFNPPNRHLYKGDPNHPCATSTWMLGQCMIRFCTALEKGSVNLDGLSRVTNQKCNLPGKEHKYHYFNPYDFERWKGLKDAYVFEASSPCSSNPCQGSRHTTSQ